MLVEQTAYLFCNFFTIQNSYKYLHKVFCTDLLMELCTALIHEHIK